MPGLGQDIRDALRQIRRHVGHATAVVATLALACGGVTAVFTVADPVLFRPLPYDDVDRVVRASTRSDRGTYPMFRVDFLRVLQEARSFEAIGEEGDCISGGLHPDADPSRDIRGCTVSQGYLPALGVRPALGREFTADEHDVTAPVALITHDLWTDHFGGRRDVLGQRLTLHPGGPTFLVVGVLPRRFVYPDFNNQAPAFLAPGRIERTPGPRPPHLSLALPVLRLKAGVPIEQARAELDRIFASVAHDVPELAANPRFSPTRYATLSPISAVLFARTRQTMTMLLAVTGLVLLLAGANLAHLLTARLRDRRRELATRQALGASRIRLMRMLSVELLILAAAAAAGALVVGKWMLDGITAALPEQAHIYRAIPAVVDGRVVAAATLLSLLTLMFCGLVSAGRAARTNIRDEFGAAAVPAHGRRSRFALLSTQAFVAVFLVLTALLLVENFVRLSRQDFGFDPAGIRVAGVDPSAGTHGNAAAMRALAEALETGIQSATGADAALGHVPAMYQSESISRPGSPPVRRSLVEAYQVTAEAFQLLRIRSMRGRLLSPDESRTDARVIVVDERAAHLLWPGENALGKWTDSEHGKARMVIGVVPSVKTVLMPDAFQSGTAFVPLSTEPRGPWNVMWRGPAPPSLARDLGAAVRSIDPMARVSIAGLRLFEYQLGQPRFLAILLGSLGTLAIALAVVGLYGVVKNGVVQRTRELGLRMALGADRGRIGRMVVLEAVAPCAIGVALGIAICLWWTQALDAFLTGIRPHDPAVFTVAAAVVIGLVALAALGPARRATRVDPMTALRAE